MTKTKYDINKYNFKTKLELINIIYNKYKDNNSIKIDDIEYYILNPYIFRKYNSMDVHNKRFYNMLSRNVTTDFMRRAGYNEIYMLFYEFLNELSVYTLERFIFENI